MYSVDCLVGVITVLVCPVCRRVFILIRYVQLCVCVTAVVCFSSPLKVGLRSTVYTGLPDCRCPNLPPDVGAVS